MSFFGTLILFGICYVIAETHIEQRDAKRRLEDERYEDALRARRRSYRAPGDI
jgi:hypothetical protein